MVAGHDGRPMLYCADAPNMSLHLVPSIRSHLPREEISRLGRMGRSAGRDASTADEISCALSVRAKLATPSRRAAFWLARQEVVGDRA
jgi:hypothetical protein